VLLGVEIVVPAAEGVQVREYHAQSPDPPRQRDLIGAANVGEPVCNDECRASTHEVTQPSWISGLRSESNWTLLRPGSKCADRQDRASNAKRVVSGRQRVLLRVRRPPFVLVLERLPPNSSTRAMWQAARNFLLSHGFRSRKSNVLPDRAIEKKSFLQYDAECVRKNSVSPSRDPTPVDQHAPARRTLKRAISPMIVDFPAPERTDQSRDRSRFRTGNSPRVELLSCVVSKAHVSISTRPFTRSSVCVRPGSFILQLLVRIRACAPDRNRLRDLRPDGYD